MTEADLQRMSHVMRHRLRNISAGLRGSLLLLEEEVGEMLPPGLKEYFPLIYRECDDLQTLSQRISLYFDFLEDGDLCSADEVVRRVLFDLSSRFPSVSFRIQGHCDDLVDGAMGSALTEVLVNACEAAPSGLVEVRYERRASHVYWTILDTGPGIELGEGEKDPFLPFMTTRSRHLGLGLAIARRLCDKEGGGCRALRVELEDGFSTCVEMSAQRR